MCEICKEDECSEVIGVEVTIKYENPKAYGYPEIVYWDEKYKVKNCPFCGRKLENTK